jgi:hypothetical protein
VSDAADPAWSQQESVEAQASAAFAFRYWTSVENMTADPGIERVETDAPRLDRPGLQGRSHSTAWRPDSPPA